MRRLAVLVCLSIGTLATGAAGWAAAAPVPLTLITVTNMLHTPEFVAVEKGFFLKHGLDVKFPDAGAPERAGLARA